MGAGSNQFGQLGAGSNQLDQMGAGSNQLDQMGAGSNQLDQMMQEVINQSGRWQQVGLTTELLSTQHPWLGCVRGPHNDLNSIQLSTSRITLLLTLMETLTLHGTMTSSSKLTHMSSLQHMPKPLNRHCAIPWCGILSQYLTSL